MKSLSLYIFIIATIIKSISTFNCKDVKLESKNTLDKAIRYELHY